MKVICIGAGMSGIQTGVQFLQKTRNLELVIYEKNADVGGTWYEKRYPGLEWGVSFQTLRLVNGNDTDKNLQISHLRHINTHMRAIPPGLDSMRRGRKSKLTSKTLLENIMWKNIANLAICSSLQNG